MIVGVAVAMSSGKVLEGLLFAVSATDIGALIVASMLLGTLTVFACIDQTVRCTHPFAREEGRTSSATRARGLSIATAITSVPFRTIAD